MTLPEAWYSQRAKEPVPLLGPPDPPVALVDTNVKAQLLPQPAGQTGLLPPQQSWCSAWSSQVLTQVYTPPPAQPSQVARLPTSNPISLLKGLLRKPSLSQSAHGNFWGHRSGCIQACEAPGKVFQMLLGKISREDHWRSLSPNSHV